MKAAKRHLKLFEKHLNNEVHSPNFYNPVIKNIKHCVQQTAIKQKGQPTSSEASDLSEHRQITDLTPNNGSV